METTLKAVEIQAFGSLEVLAVIDLPDPSLASGILSAQPSLVPYWVNRVFAGWSWQRLCLGACLVPGLAGGPGGEVEGNREQRHSPAAG